MVGENFCNDSKVLGAFLFIKNLILIAQMAVPYIIIIMLTIEVVKATTAQDTKALVEVGKKALFRIALGISIFFIPTLLDVIINQIDTENEFMVCYQNANSEYIAVRKKEEAAQAELERQRKKEEEKKRKEAEQKELENRRKPSVNTTITNVDTSNQSGPITSTSLTAIKTDDLAVPLYYSDHKTVFKTLTFNSQIAQQAHNILYNVSVYVKQHNSLIPRFETAGAYVNKALQHGKGLAIDLFNQWSFTKNGKTYSPYSGYKDFPSYERFVCEVCNGVENCEYNINYQIYERFFKGNGWCWGGNWGANYFDPMHYEISVGGKCSTSNKPSFNCSKY